MQECSSTIVAYDLEREAFLRILGELRETHIITKYEQARVTGVRADQLHKGAPPLVPTSDLVHAMEIAQRELQSGVLPLEIMRQLPNGGTAIVALHDAGRNILA
jgi:DNA-directed RNA polymerase subunit K/omega